MPNDKALFFLKELTNNEQVFTKKVSYLLNMKPLIIETLGTNATFESMMDTLPAIKEFSIALVNLFEKLVNAYRHDDTANIPNYAKEIIELSKIHFENLKDYCVNYGKFQSSGNVNKNTVHKLDKLFEPDTFNSIIAEPMQRVGRYPMTFEVFINEVASGHECMPEFKDILGSFKTGSMLVNEGIRNSQSMGARLSPSSSSSSSSSSPASSDSDSELGIDDFELIRSWVDQFLTDPNSADMATILTNSIVEPKWGGLAHGFRQIRNAWQWEGFIADAEKLKEFARTLYQSKKYEKFPITRNAILKGYIHAHLEPYGTEMNKTQFGVMCNKLLDEIDSRLGKKWSTEKCAKEYEKYMNPEPNKNPSP